MLSRHLPVNLQSFERGQMTSPVRDVLCDFAAGDLTRQLRHSSLDWTEALAVIARNGLLGMTDWYLAASQHAALLPADVRQRVRALVRLDALRMAYLYRVITPVLERLNASGLAFLVLKGPALAHSIYPEPQLRVFSDLDIMVREIDWKLIHEVLLEMGFVAQDGWTEPAPKLDPALTIYEVKYHHPDTGLRVEVHFDDLLNAGLVSRDLEGYWQRAVMVQIQGVAVQTLCLEDQLIHLCAHAHYHGYTRLNWLTDLALLVRDRGDQINWHLVVLTARREEAEVPVYYTLRCLKLLLWVAAPPEVLSALRPSHVRRVFHEWYLPEAAVLSLSPMYRPDFSFYFMPLLKRLLPDLLVMGRRRDKLRILLRLVFPPPAWLRSYYRLTPRASLAPHYLLHPAKLLVHYSRELYGAAAQRLKPGARARQVSAGLRRT